MQRLILKKVSVFWRYCFFCVHKAKDTKMKTAIKREQRKACFSDAEREQFGRSQKSPAGLQRLP